MDKPLESDPRLPQAETHHTFRPSMKRLRSQDGSAWHTAISPDSKPPSKEDFKRRKRSSLAGDECSAQKPAGLPANGAIEDEDIAAQEINSGSGSMGDDDDDDSRLGSVSSNGDLDDLNSGEDPLLDGYDSDAYDSDDLESLALALKQRGQSLDILHILLGLSRRPKLAHINTIDDAVRLIKESHNIVVLTGAGVSVSCGIPDFRSKNGIYSRLDEFELEDPQQMFDLEYFKYRPEIFYSFAKEIFPSNFRPSPSHMFVKLLEEKGKLLRNYTQNIDTLEQVAQIGNVVQCHGSFATASCIVCKHQVDGKAIKDDILAKTVPLCPKCPEEADGIMKPDIVFFGEKLPQSFDAAFAEDRDKIDLLIVMGSSLKVSPVANVKDHIPRDVPQILINLEALPHMAGFDIQLLGYCDVIVQELCRRLSWSLPAAPQSLKGDSVSAVNEAAPVVAAPFTFIPPNRYLFEGAISAQADSDAQLDSDELSPQPTTFGRTESLGDLSNSNMPI
ncbi:DHS-like NAD/FAD-binding domain-containing protein [Polychytrium aggregatum]|uniref:DHS-like NAD/FAD-binding domain-containing protein n=1 Tax=Polychytrium aggregatum TaxID=110093 RepID=UPI0022FE00B3|nr:DHS-like NAD/FAD-binding domain-containing protein [Polychytrium aggregatum]KAI9202789.1 DHS-like NAD/FAD-binding domain-containing protein [Polychytrium aggregatum]